MRSFCAFITLFFTASGMVVGVPPTAKTASLKAVYNPNFVRHAPTELLKAHRKFGVNPPPGLVDAVGRRGAGRPTGPNSNSTEPSTGLIKPHRNSTEPGTGLIKPHRNSTEPGTGLTGTTINTPSPPFDTEYVIEVEVGTPPQTVSLIFDTGSSDLWIMSSETPQELTQGHALYDPSKSTTSQRSDGLNWSITYGSGQKASGDVFTDKVTIGGISVPKQLVESPLEMSADLGRDQFNSGIIGFAFDNLMSIPGQTWFTNAAPHLESALFTANLNHQSNGTYNFGFINESEHTGPIVYTPVDTSLGFWQITLSGYSIGDVRVSDENLTAIADTGTTLILMPQDVVDNYYFQVESSWLDSESSFFAYNCSERLPDFGFGINNQTITIPGELMVFSNLDDEGHCAGSLQVINGGIIILGDPAFKAALAVFDTKGPDGTPRVGWGQK